MARHFSSSIGVWLRFSKIPKSASFCFLVVVIIVVVVVAAASVIRVAFLLSYLSLCCCSAFHIFLFFYYESLSARVFVTSASQTFLRSMWGKGI